MNLKIHLVAVALILVLLVIASRISGPSGTAPAEDAEQLYIEIVSASAGLNCLDRNGNLLPQYEGRDRPVYQDEDGASLHTDNILQAVSRNCNGKQNCTVYASAKEFGITAVPGCSKEVEVGYRCFSYDRLRTARGRDGSSLKIDCQNIDK